MAKDDLTSLARVKEWLQPAQGSLSAQNDALLERLITLASQFVLGYLCRDSLRVTQYSDRYDSGGRDFLLLRQWPVVSVQAIQFGNVTINQPAGFPPQPATYYLEPPPEGNGQQRLQIYGYCFPRGRNVVCVQYQAGYQMTDTVVVPSSGPVVTERTWLQDQGVTYTSSGAALTKVANNPAAGQYTCDSSGNYGFAAADISASVDIAYSYVPADLEGVVIELVGERYKARDRIGLDSKDLPNGGSVRFQTKDLNAYCASVLQPYQRVTPS